MLRMATLEIDHLKASISGAAQQTVRTVALSPGAVPSVKSEH